MSSPGIPFPLGRRVHHDPRSRDFAFAARPEAAEPVRSVRWTRRCTIFDQGQLGSCTGNAAAGWLGTDDAEQTGRADVTEALAIDLYAAATKLDPFPGYYAPGDPKSEDTGSDGLSVAKVLKGRGLIESYTHCFSLIDVLTALQSGPVLAGTSWYDGMFNPGARGLVEISGSVAGGHEYLLVGVDTDLAEVVFANSWGDGWGEHGYGRMSYDTLRRLLSGDGDATVPHAPVPVRPQPSPGAASFQVVVSDDVAAVVRARAVRAGVTVEQWIAHRITKDVGE